MIADVAYRVGTLEDLARVLRVERGAVEAPHWTDEAWRASFVSGARARVVFVAECGGEICGYIALSAVGGVAEVENVAVAKVTRRRGVARELMQLGIRWARQDACAERMELEVRASNEPALRLYRSLGFEDEARRIEYYGDPQEDAVLMGMRLR